MDGERPSRVDIQHSCNGKPDGLGSLGSKCLRRAASHMAQTQFTSAILVEDPCLLDLAGMLAGAGPVPPLPDGSYWRVEATQAVPTPDSMI